MARRRPPHPVRRASIRRPYSSLCCVDERTRPQPASRNTMTPSRWLASSRIKRCIVAACCAFGMAAASADTVTLTFDHIGDLGPYPDSWTESGFSITSLEPSGGHLHSGADSLLLHSREG